MKCCQKCVLISIPIYSHEFPKSLVCTLPTEDCWNNKHSSCKDEKKNFDFETVSLLNWFQWGKEQISTQTKNIFERLNKLAASEKLLKSSKSKHHPSFCTITSKKNSQQHILNIRKNLKKGNQTPRFCRLILLKILALFIKMRVNLHIGIKPKSPCLLLLFVRMESVHQLS